MIPSDFVITPDWVVEDMVAFFKPTGKILDPCRGNGAFTRHLPPDTEWCEIKDGRNFFDFNKPMDWIIGNPPYSCFREFLKHSFDLSPKVLFLTPYYKATNALGVLRIVKSYGWMSYVRIYDTGRAIPWSRSRPISAILYERNVDKFTSFSFCVTKNIDSLQTAYNTPMAGGVPPQICEAQTSP